MNRKIYLLIVAHLYIYRCTILGQVNGQDSLIQTTDSLPTKMVVKGIQEVVNNTKIKTVQLNRSDLQLAYPIITLGSEDILDLGFDDLRGGVRNYYYTFEHCDQQWESSGLSSYDFLEGFEENRIDTYRFSFATLQRYTHYALSFPNNDVQFRISGNYVIKVWEEDNRDTPVLIKRFFVV